MQNIRQQPRVPEWVCNVIDDIDSIDRIFGKIRNSRFLSAIHSHVTTGTTFRASEGCSKVLLFRTFPMLVFRRATVPTTSYFIISQGSIKSCQLTKLHPLQVVLPFRCIHTLFDNLFDLQKYNQRKKNVPRVL